jgi:hypothetical protein
LAGTAPTPIYVLSEIGKRGDIETAGVAADAARRLSLGGHITPNWNGKVR